MRISSIFDKMTKVGDKNVRWSDKRPEFVSPSLTGCTELNWLTENTIYGKFGNPVAQQVLTSGFARMKEENYKPSPGPKE